MSAHRDIWYRRRLTHGMQAAVLRQGTGSGDSSATVIARKNLVVYLYRSPLLVLEL